jgi:hypothetical protein
MKQTEQFATAKLEAADDLYEKMAELKKLREQVRRAEASRSKQPAADDANRLI